MQIKKNPNKKYLGDGAYVQHDGWSYIITTENGISAQNEVRLEDSAMDVLFRYRQRIEGGRKAKINPQAPE